MSYMPPELAQEPMEMTQRGSIICSYRRWLAAAIVMTTVNEMTMTPDWRGEARSTSAPKRAMSCGAVNAVVISTKQQDRPQLYGHSECLRPQATMSSSLAVRILRSIASRSLGSPVAPEPGDGFLSARDRDQVIGDLPVRLEWDESEAGSSCPGVVCVALHHLAHTLFAWRLRCPFSGSGAPGVCQRQCQDDEEDHHLGIAEPAHIPGGNGPGKDEDHFQIDYDEENGDQVELGGKAQAGAADRHHAGF